MYEFIMYIFLQQKIKFWLVIFSNSIQKEQNSVKDRKFSIKILALVFCKIYEEIKMSYEYGLKRLQIAARETRTVFRERMKFKTVQVLGISA